MREALSSARNPAGAADPPSASRTRVQSWTAGELRRLLGHVRHDRLYAMWRLAATTGMRRGELLGLSHLALDLDGARLRVNRQLRVRLAPTGRRSRPELGAHDRPRRRNRSQVLRRSHRRRSASSATSQGPPMRTRIVVFCDELGRPRYARADSARPLSRLRKAAREYRSGALHVLRPAAATLALTAKPPVPLHVVAGRLGDDPKNGPRHIRPPARPLGRDGGRLRSLPRFPLTSR